MNSVNLDKYSDPFFLGETKEELRRIRQDFHVHPEIGLVTPRTSRIIADLLKDTALMKFTKASVETVSWVSFTENFWEKLQSA